jgi:hypothetical protein
MKTRSLALPALVMTGLLAFTPTFGANAGMGQSSETKVPVTFTGGHEIGRQDYGRPVVLMGPALGVTPDVFRKAFSGVTPARGRGPSPEEARQNKDALMKVLAPYGVTNERMDEVANYYRFRPDRSELWPTSPAKAYAVVEAGRLKRIVVTEPGSGYSSPPDVRVEGVKGVALKATLHFDKDLKKNGGIAAIEIVPARKQPTDH